jgi:hypothetical protein
MASLGFAAVLFCGFGGLCRWIRALSDRAFFVCAFSKDGCAIRTSAAKITSKRSAHDSTRLFIDHSTFMQRQQARRPLSPAQEDLRRGRTDPRRNLGKICRSSIFSEGDFSCSKFWFHAWIETREISATTTCALGTKPDCSGS